MKKDIYLSELKYMTKICETEANNDSEDEE